jgi:hypothetical protein
VFCESSSASRYPHPEVCLICSALDNFRHLATFRQALNCPRVGCRSIRLFPPACCKSLFSQPLLFAFLTPFLRVALEKSKIGTKAELRFRKKVPEKGGWHLSGKGASHLFRFFAHGDGQLYQ